MGSNLQSQDHPSITKLYQLMQQELPIALQDLNIRHRKTGLIIVDIVNGFATVGAGPLAPIKPNQQVSQMVNEANKLAKIFVQQGWPILAFLDTHIPGKVEEPYPLHCESGSGQDELVPALSWLTNNKHATLIRKDCINGFIGAYRSDGQNELLTWIHHHHLENLLVVGICTDICVMDLVLTLLSARNHGLLGRVKDIFVYEAACATYDLSKIDAQEQGLPNTSVHPQYPTHHMGLYFMAARGARLVKKVVS